MKFTITREHLLAPLQQVVGVIEKRQTMAILSNVLIRLADRRIELTGTDLEVQLVSKVDSESGEDGEITVPARKFLDICRTLPDSCLVHVETQQDRLAIWSGRSRFSLSTLPAINYPSFELKFPEVELFLDSRLLKKALEKTLFAMAVQDVRYFLNGLMVEVKENLLRAVSSDGHRLALFEETLPASVPIPRQIIIPRKGVIELYRLLGEENQETCIQISPNNIRLILGDILFSSKLIEGRFPDYRRVMPAHVSNIVSVDKATFKAALTRVSVLSTDKLKGISLDLKGRVMRLTAQNSDHEEALDEFDVDFDGDELSIGFNATYLLDAISNIDSEEVRLSFPESVNSCLIEDSVNQQFRFIVMPMRL